MMIIKNYRDSKIYQKRQQIDINSGLLVMITQLVWDAMKLELKMKEITG